jgi:hypothetical protein
MLLMCRTFKVTMRIAFVLFPFAFAPATMAESGAGTHLLGLGPQARAMTLGKVVGGGCIGQTAFYMGNSTSPFISDNVLWSVRCQDGREFAIEERPNRNDRVLGCAALKAQYARECFKWPGGTLY